jgi:hypothetical protein
MLPGWKTSRQQSTMSGPWPAGSARPRPAGSVLGPWPQGQPLACKVSPGRAGRSRAGLAVVVLQPERERRRPCRRSLSGRRPGRQPLVAALRGTTSTWRVPIDQSGLLWPGDNRLRGRFSVQYSELVAFRCNGRVRSRQERVAAPRTAMCPHSGLLRGPLRPRFAPLRARDSSLRGPRFPSQAAICPVRPRFAQSEGGLCPRSGDCYIPPVMGRYLPSPVAGFAQSGCRICPVRFPVSAPVRGPAPPALWPPARTGPGRG